MGGAGSRWLVLRRAAALWAVPSASVRAVRRRGAGADILLASSSSLQADELLGLAAELERRSFPTCVPSGAAGPVAGLAVWNGTPVACLDPSGPLPAALLPRTHDPRTSETLAPGGPEDADA